MISGFNTDIEYNGVVYHVQTEDKGLRSAELMTLVYNKGTILASKRSSYEDLVAGDLDNDALAERLNRQHKLMCAAIKAGRIDELTKMTRDKSAAKRKPSAGKSEEAEPEPAPVIAPPAEAVAFAPVPVPETIRFEMPPNAPLAETPVSKPNLEDLFVDAPLIEDVSIVEEEIVLDPTAVAVVSELSGIERASNEKLTIELFGEGRYRSGDRVTLNLLICRGTARRVVADAEIMVKALGSEFRPIIYHAKSDPNGLANIHFQIPVFRAGRAALLIRVIADGEEVELRRIITPG